MSPHLGMITRLCIQGVEAEWGIEETCPRASPLTLTGITKGPKNKGKGKEKEMKDALVQNIGKVQFKCNQKSREVKTHSGMCP